MSSVTGFFPTMSRSEYDELAYLNFSRLKYMERSPLAFRYHCDNPMEPTEPMRLGSVAHTMVLEPSKLAEDCAVWPGPGRRFGKEWDLFCEEHAGKTLLNKKERDFVVGMVNAVHANPIAKKYLRHAKTEVSMVWHDHTFRRDFKGRIDAVIDIDDEPVLVSLKSTVDCRDFRFGSQFYKMAYYVQDAMYQNGYFYLTSQLPRVVTIAVESKPPHETAVYSIPNDVLRQGQADLAKWMVRLAECEKKNRWPAAVEDEQELQLPAYAYPGGDFDMSDLEPIAR